MPIKLTPKIPTPKKNIIPWAEMANMGVNFFPLGERDFKQAEIFEMMSADEATLVLRVARDKKYPWLRERKFPEKGIRKLCSAEPNPTSTAERMAADLAQISLLFSKTCP